MKKSLKPECTDDQSERFKQAARELGCDDGEALERAFGKIVPPKRLDRTSEKPTTKGAANDRS